MRRLLLLVGAIVAVDLMFYAAITPLLPEYADRFDLSKTGAGILAGSYAAGAVIGSVPSGWLVTRVGSRRTVLVGLALMSIASLGFAFGQTIVVLDALRFLQGIGGACTWAGGLGWLISMTPQEQRGRTIGAALSAALIGLLLGPVLGALAREIGPELPFSAIAVLGGLLAIAALQSPAPPLAAATRRPLAAVLRVGPIRTGMWLIAMSALVFGTIEVLTPLELDRLGASGPAIAVVFLVAAGLEGIAQLVAGHAADRRGSAWPIRIGLAGSLAFMLLVPFPQVAWLLGIVVALGCVISGALNTPATTLLSEGVEAAGLDQGLGFALVNFMWSSGQVVGTIAGGALAAATSDTVPYLLLAVICGATLVTFVRSDRRVPLPTRAA